jgi:predicted nucleotidyltransferase
MRLTSEEQRAVRTTFEEVFGAGEIYLFGSRVDGRRRGGDIDLYLRPTLSHNLVKKKIEFLVRLKAKIGQQKIDVVLPSRHERPIDRIARAEGIRL